MESRDLDTDERERSTHEVPAPRGPSELRERLVDLVRVTHPGAEPRSYADGAATFLDRQHLVVTSYADPLTARGEQRRRTTATAAVRHEQLFDL